MEGGRQREKDDPASQLTHAVRHVRKMHSFDRRIKFVHQDRNPDVAEQLPSYMRQTCASLVKRSPLKSKATNRGKQRKEMQGKETQPAPQEEKLLARRKSTGDIPEGRTCPRPPPRSELSILDEETEEDRSSPSHSERSEVPTDGDGENKLDALPHHLPASQDDFRNHGLALSRLADGYGLRRPSISSNMTLEEAFSEVGHEESFCRVFDSVDEDDDDNSVIIDRTIGPSPFFCSKLDAQPLSPLTTHSAKLDTNASEADADWSDDGNLCTVESHCLTDLLGSLTDSECGDDTVQSSLEEEASYKTPLGLEMKHEAAQKHAPEKRHVADSRPGQRADGHFQLSPGFLWMLGGNVLAGVVGAALASAGIPVSSHESDRKDAATDGDGVHSDDWFFQASSRVSLDM